jgi:hypothetical protein
MDLLGEKEKGIKAKHLDAGTLARPSRVKPFSSFAWLGGREGPPYGLDWHGRLSLWTEEGHLHDLGCHRLADSFDGDFHLQFGAKL